MKKLFSFFLIFLCTCSALAKYPTIYYFDMVPTRYLSNEKSYDQRHAIVCLQGLVNREAPRMFVRYFEAEDDLVWLSRMREENGICENWKVKKIESTAELFAKFGHYAKGVVLYETNPQSGPASTSLVATTVAGAEDCIAIRKDIASGSMYNWLVNDPEGPQLPVFLDLTGKFTGSGTIWQTTIASTGSAKCDAYIWAIEKYLKTGKCNPATLGLYLDLWGLNIEDQDFTDLINLDYMVANKGFCFDLSPFSDEVPNDDPCQPLGTDRETMIKIFDECNNQLNKSQMIEVCGFPDWQYKYSTSAGGNHHPVTLEHTFASFVTVYNGYLDVDFMLPNMSFYAGLWPAIKDKQLTQNPPPSYDDLVDQGLIDASGEVVPGNYVCLILGDYDCTAWLALRMAHAGDQYSNSTGGVWMDKTRGEIPCNWGINPNLAKRTSAVFDYIYRHKSDKDYFCAWDSGAGYIIPSRLRVRANGYPDGSALWQKHCRDIYRITDYSITGWLLEKYGLEQVDAEVYSEFSSDGIGGHYGGKGFAFWDQEQSDGGLVNSVPVNNVSGGSDPTQNDLIDYSSGVHFASCRAVNWDTDGNGNLVPWGPDEVKLLMDQYSTSGNNHKFLDVYSFYYLMRYHYGGNNNYRAAWLGDTVPRVIQSGNTYQIEVTVRNDGWNSWTRSDSFGLGFSIELKDSGPRYQYRSYIPEGAEIKTGETVKFSFEVTAPQDSGIYDVQYDMVREGVTWFQGKGNVEWKEQIIVTDDILSIDSDGDGLSDVYEMENDMLYWHPDDSKNIELDINQDGVINFKDFSAFAEKWMTE